MIHGGTTGNNYLVHMAKIDFAQNEETVMYFKDTFVLASRQIQTSIKKKNTQRQCLIKSDFTG